ncbi:tetratricopeptide repeat protein [Fluviicola sp.]|uniref:tetratricopeptide repeat protein n=1 Tax=Fluviicola sp. TaxID=1917219 RepID=UPI003D29934B
MASNVFALRDKSNELLDSKAERLAKVFDSESFERTVQFVRKEKWDSVLVNTEKLLQQLKKQPLLDYVHYYRAEAFHKKGILKYALKEFDQVRQDFEFYTMVRFNKGGIFLSQEKYNQALKVFKSIDTSSQKKIKTIRIDALFQNTGICYLHLGDYIQSEKYLLRAIQKIREKKIIARSLPPTWI